MANAVIDTITNWQHLWNYIDTYIKSGTCIGIIYIFPEFELNILFKTIFTFWNNICIVNIMVPKILNIEIIESIKCNIILRFLFYCHIWTKTAKHRMNMDLKYLKNIIN